MDLREATADDADAVRSIARRSLRSSYTDFLDEETVDTAVDRWYDEDAITTLLESDEALVVVVEVDGEVAAFSQSEVVADGHTVGQILWLHVDPAHRGEGIGVRLLHRTREALLESGADEIRGVVLARNELGNAFYENQGFERMGTREIEVGEETHTETVYVERSLEPDEEWRALEPMTVGDETIYVSYGEAARGSKAPFYTAYRDEDGAQRYGWFCGNCDSLDNAMDSMGRIECNGCGNRRKATRWDASYL